MSSREPYITLTLQHIQETQVEFYQVLIIGDQKKTDQSTP